MKIVRIPFEVSLGAGAPRAPGLHLTDVTSDIALMTGVLKPEYADRDVTKPGSIYRVSLGIAWEQWIVKQHPEVMHQPGEIVKDGIPMTPDGYGWDSSGGLIIHEWKATYKSMIKEDSLDGEWLWMAQLKGYCCGAETNHGRLHVFWVNGDYRSSGPQYRIYDIKFSDREIKENWQMILRHAEKLRAKQ